MTKTPEELAADALPCICDMESGQGSPRKHWTSCPASFRPAVAAAIEKAVGESLEAAMKAVCEGCREAWPFTDETKKWHKLSKSEWQCDCRASRIRALAHGGDDED